MIVGGGFAVGSRALGQALHRSPTAAQLAADPRRPQYHLLPAANWMNDPDGPVYWRGEYHMFYQYNPGAPVWGDMHWGHAVSPNMVHWRHLPIALAPTPGGPDAAGCFTGSALYDGERVAVLYTGVVSVPEREATIHDGVHSLRESQCLAFAAGDDLRTWSKVPSPVIAAPPAGLDVIGFRDPAAWREGKIWWMVIGSGIRGRGGVALLYRSHDLHLWEYLHPLAEGSLSRTASPAEGGDMWECPDFFPLGDRHVLIHSTGGKTYWQSGVFDASALVFRAERSGVLDHGSFYAAKTQLDQSQNRILWGWIPETRSVAEYRAAGWAGMMSLPRLLCLDANHDLETRPAPEVVQLRSREQQLRLSGDEVADRRQLASMRIDNCCGEIVCSFRRGTDPVTISLLSPEGGGQSWLTCRYDPTRADQVVIDGKVMSLGAGKSHNLELCFLIDGSVIECFANRHSAFTKRFYYSGSNAPAIGAQITGNMASLTALKMWQLSPISNNRLTT